MLVISIKIDPNYTFISMHIQNPDFITKYILPLVFCFLCLSSCNDTPTENGLTKIVVDTATEDSLPLSLIAKSIEYIPIESHPEALLGRYGSPRFFKDGIIISSNRSLYCFKPDGKYNYKIYDDIDGLEAYIGFRKWYNGKMIATFNSIDILDQENIKEAGVYQKLIKKGWEPDIESNPVIALYDVTY